MATPKDFEGAQWGDKVEITYTPAATEENKNPQPVTETVVFREVRPDGEPGAQPEANAPIILRHSKPRGRQRTHTPLRAISAVKILVDHTPKEKAPKADKAEAKQPAGATA